MSPVLLKRDMKMWPPSSGAFSLSVHHVSLPKPVRPDPDKQANSKPNKSCEHANGVTYLVLNIS